MSEQKPGFAVECKGITVAEQKRDVKNKPCYGCSDRHIACSDHCQKPEFIAWKEEQDRIREAKRLESAIWGYTANEIRKNRRIRRKHG